MEAQLENANVPVGGGSQQQQAESDPDRDSSPPPRRSSSINDTSAVDLSEAGGEQSDEPML